MEADNIKDTTEKKATKEKKAKKKASKKKTTKKVKGSTKISHKQQSFVATIRPPAVVMVPGGTALFSAVLNDQDGKKMAKPKWIWNSASPSVAMVDTQGRVIALSVGMSDIKVTDPKTNAFAIAKVTVIP